MNSCGSIIVISERQDKITNYSNENDYVNFLLNDVGERHYIKADKNVDHFFDNHSLFSISDAYPIEENLTTQNELIQHLDTVLNSYLRTLPPWQKDATMSTLGEWLTYLFGDEQECTTFMMIKGIYVIGDFLAYAAQYAFKYPALGKWLSWLGETFPVLGPVIDSAIWLSHMGFGPKIHPDGDDIHYASSGSAGGANKIRVDTDALESMEQQLRSLSSELADCAQQLRGTASGCMDSIARHRISLGIGAIVIRGLRISVAGTTAATIRRMASSAEQIAERCSELSSALQKVRASFEETENNMVGMLE